MKVLFAVSNESISEAIVKKYQKEYKEIITYKNVYYFNAILKELQRDKTYDRVVISEDLEPFTNKNYDAIDKFIFEKLDSISDEASNAGNDIPIILICTDRRTRAEQMLIKLFGIGIYNALLGQDRSIDKVCELIHMPRSKKEAKLYYKIESDDVNYQAESEDSVSEIEIQNILAHYKKISRSPERFVDSFNNIAAQYNDAQLRLIVKFLPLNVKTVLEEESPKYQSVMTFGDVKAKNKYTSQKEKTVKEPLKMNLLEDGRKTLTKPVIVPGVTGGANKKLVKSQPMDEKINLTKNQTKEVEEPIVPKIQTRPIKQEETKKETEEILLGEPVKRGRGRPRKVVQEQEIVSVPQEKKKRGRPRKVVEQKEDVKDVSKATVLPGLEEENILPGFENENVLPGFENESVLPGFEEEVTLPGFEDVESEQTEENILPGFEELETETPVTMQKETILPGIEEVVTPVQKKEDNGEFILPGFEKKQSTTGTETNRTFLNEVQNPNSAQGSISSLLTRDKKIVSFVGTSKNGTSFIVNNLAVMIARMGMNVAILDMTKNRNAYYIYTQNDENLRKKAYECMQKLEQGIADGIAVNKNLSVYTSLPDENLLEMDVVSIMGTLVQTYDLVLIDCDFDTPEECFREAQEIYLVQSMDILTIQPLTAFLKELKVKDILQEEKIKVVINKEMKVRGLTPKVLIGGMSSYNDPAMSFMTGLFNKDTVQYCTIPFEIPTYSKYLEGLVNCEVSLNGYSKMFLTSLKTLAGIVYPLINNKYARKNDYSKNNKFSSDINNTLDQMKNKY